MAIFIAHFGIGFENTVLIIGTSKNVTLRIFHLLWHLSVIRIILHVQCWLQTHVSDCSRIFTNKCISFWPQFLAFFLFDRGFWHFVRRSFHDFGNFLIFFRNVEMNYGRNWKYPPEPEIKLIGDNNCFGVIQRNSSFENWWQILFTRKFQEESFSTNGSLSPICHFCSPTVKNISRALRTSIVRATFPGVRTFLFWSTASYAYVS